LTKVKLVESAPPSPDSLAPSKAASRRPKRSKALLLALLAPLVLAGCKVPSFGVSDGVSKTSHDTFTLWQGFSIAAIVIGGLTLLVIVWAIFRYRRRSDDIPKQTQYNIPLELLYTVVPILIVFGLFAATVVVENEVVADPTPKATINVAAFQWGWKFTYPGHRAVVVGQTTEDPEMVMPADQNVRINLVSLDVVHGFYVRAFNFSRYAQPGMTNTFTFRITKTGIYNGQCTQLCGLYHSLMFFKIKVVSPAQFQAWLAQEDASTSAASAAAANLVVPYQNRSVVPTKPAYTNYGAN
jgi:cytochrome c oxidase subunit 2